MLRKILQFVTFLAGYTVMFLKYIYDMYGFENRLWFILVLLLLRNLIVFVKTFVVSNIIYCTYRMRSIKITITIYIILISVVSKILFFSFRAATSALK